MPRNEVATEPRLHRGVAELPLEVGVAADANPPLGAGHTLTFASGKRLESPSSNGSVLPSSSRSKKLQTYAFTTSSARNRSMVPPSRQRRSGERKFISLKFE